MGNIIKRLIKEKYSTYENFWNNYVKTYPRNISSSYRKKLMCGQREVPIDILRNIFTMLEVGTIDILELSHQYYEVTK